MNHMKQFHLVSPSDMDKLRSAAKTILELEFPEHTTEEEAIALDGVAQEAVRAANAYLYPCRGVYIHDTAAMAAFKQFVEFKAALESMNLPAEIPVMVRDIERTLFSVLAWGDIVDKET